MPLNIPDSSLPRVVIIGAGFAGFTLARKLAGNNYQIVLVDRNNYHQFQPLFYQVGMAGLEPSSICFPLRKSFQSDPGFFVRVTEVHALDTAGKRVITEAGNFKYDILILAMGARTNYYGNDEFEKNSIPLKSVSESLYLRNTLLGDLESALLLKDGEDLAPWLDLVIVGGGPTGVELAGALAELKKYIIPRDYPDLAHDQMDIHLVQGADRLLPSMSAQFSAKALGDLQKMGVRVHLGQRVLRIDNGRVSLSGGTSLFARKVIWAAGVSPAILPGLPESACAPDQRILVDSFLQVQGLEDVYALGDIACVVTPDTPQGLPQVAPVALQQAAWLAKFLRKKSNRPFKYTDKGTMATIGRNKAVVDIGSLHFSGFFAWVTWLFVHIYYLIGVRNKLVVLLNWTWSYLFFDQALRLLIKPFTKNVQKTS